MRRMLVRMSTSAEATSPASEPDADLVVVVYTSVATQEPSRDDLAAMLDGARRRNAARGITGLLVYHDGCFMQAMEGPRPVVDDLLRRIAADGRHGAMLVLLQQPREARQFAGHSMAYRDMRDDPLPEGHSGLLNDGLRGESFRGHPDRIHRLLQIFADTQLRRAHS